MNGESDTETTASTSRKQAIEPPEITPEKYNAMNSTTQHCVAQKYVASSGEAEILGVSLIAMLENLRAADIRPILESYGLDEVEPKKWYPQQLILDVHRAIAESKIYAVDNLV